MNTKPFDANVVIAQLLANAPAFAHVGHAGSVADIRQLAAFRAPGAYVVAPRENPSPSGPANARAQAVEARVSIAIVATRYRERHSPGGNLPELVRQERAALMNWIAPWPEQSATSPIFDSGGVEDEDDSTVIWVDTWRFTHAIKG